MADFLTKILTDWQPTVASTEQAIAQIRAALENLKVQAPGGQGRAIAGAEQQIAGRVAQVPGLDPRQAALYTQRLQDPIKDFGTGVATSQVELAAATKLAAAQRRAQVETDLAGSAAYKEALAQETVGRKQSATEARAMASQDLLANGEYLRARVEQAAATKDAALRVRAAAAGVEVPTQRSFVVGPEGPTQTQERSTLVNPAETEARVVAAERTREAQIRAAASQELVADEAYLQARTQDTVARRQASAETKRRASEELSTDDGYLQALGEDIASRRQIAAESRRRASEQLAQDQLYIQTVGEDIANRREGAAQSRAFAAQELLANQEYVAAKVEAAKANQEAALRVRAEAVGVEAPVQRTFVGGPEGLEAQTALVDKAGTEAQVLAAEQLNAARQNLRNAQELAVSGGEELTIESQIRLVQAERQRALNRVTADLVKQQALSGESGGTTTQRLQSLLSASRRGGANAQAPGAFPQLGELVSGGVTQAAKFVIPAVAGFAAFQGLREMITNAEQFQQAMEQIRAQLETLGQSDTFPRIRQDILDTADATGVANTQVATLEQEFLGLYQNADQASTATRAAAEFIRVTGESAAEAGPQLAATAQDFGVSVRDVGDGIIKISQLTGRAYGDMAAAVAGVAPVAQEVGLTFTQSLQLIQAAMIGTSRTGQQVGEGLSRTLAQLVVNIPKVAQIPAVQLDQKALEGDTHELLVNLLEQWGGFSQNVRERIVADLGGTRFTALFAGLFADPAKALQTLQNPLIATGALAEANARQQQSLKGRIDELVQAFRTLGQELAQAGVTRALSDFATGAGDVVRLMTPMVKQFGDWNKALGGIPADLVLIVAGLKAVQIAIKAIEALKIASAAVQTIVGSAAGPAAAEGVAGTAIPAAAGAGVLGRLLGGGAAAGAGAAASGTGFGIGGIGAGATGGATGAAGLGVVGSGGLLTGAEVGGGSAGIVSGGVAAAPETLGASVLVAALAAGVLYVASQAKAEHKKKLQDYYTTLSAASDDALEQASKDKTGWTFDRPISSLFVHHRTDKAKIAQDILSSKGVHDAALSQADTVQAIVDANVLKPDEADQLGQDLQQALGGNKTAEDALTKAIAKYQSNPKIAISIAQSKQAQDLARQRSQYFAALADQTGGEITTGQELTQEYQAGNLSFTGWLTALNTDIDTLRAIKIPDPAVQAQLLKDVEERAKGLGAKAQEESKFATDMAKMYGSYTPQTDVDANLSILKTPGIDTATRVKAAQDLMTAEQALVQDQIDRAQSIDERAKILSQGIPVPPEVREALVEQEITQGGAKWDQFWDDVRTAGLDQSSIAKRISDLIINEGKSAKDAAIQAVTETVSQLQNEIKTMRRAGETVPPELLADLQKATDDLDSLSSDAANVPDVATPGDKAKLDPKQVDQNNSKLVSDIVSTVRAQADWAKAVANGDPVKDAQAEIDAANQTINQITAQGLQNTEDGKKAIDAANVQKLNATNQLTAANTDIAKAKVEYLKVQDKNDPLKSAQDDLTEANIEAANAHGDAAKWQALAKQLAANDAIQKAMDDIALSRITLLEAMAKAAGDDVKAAQLHVQDILTQISQAKARGAGEAEMNQLNGQLAAASADVVQQTITTTEDQLKADYDLHRITLAQYIARLTAMRALAVSQGATQKELDAIDLTIQQLKQGASNIQYNLPSDISLPTLYEARRVDATGPGHTYSPIDQRQQNFIFQITGATLDQLRQTVASAIGSGVQVYASVPKRY